MKFGGLFLWTTRGIRDFLMTFDKPKLCSLRLSMFFSHKHVWYFFTFCCWYKDGWICSSHTAAIVSAAHEKWATSDDWQADWRADRNCAVPRRPLAAPKATQAARHGDVYDTNERRCHVARRSTRPSPNSTANCRWGDSMSDLLVGVTLRDLWRRKTVKTHSSIQILLFTESRVSNAISHFVFTRNELIEFYTVWHIFATIRIFHKFDTAKVCQLRVTVLSSLERLPVSVNGLSRYKPSWPEALPDKKPYTHFNRIEI